MGGDRIPARERVETGIISEEMTLSVTFRGWTIVMQANRKAGKTRISEDDWSDYVDSLRRGESWGRKEKGEKIKGDEESL